MIKAKVWQPDRLIPVFLYFFLLPHPQSVGRTRQPDGAGSHGFRDSLSHISCCRCRSRGEHVGAYELDIGARARDDGRKPQRGQVDVIPLQGQILARRVAWHWKNRRLQPCLDVWIGVQIACHGVAAPLVAAPKNRMISCLVHLPANNSATG
jgi:hypothetical protein